jgi:hypothetical protein
VAREAKDENSVLDEVVTELRACIKESTDPDEKAKYYDRLLKALGMRRKDGGGKKGRGFDLK